MTVGIILYGAPASGKDTITQELEKRSSGYTLYRRLKSGSGRTSTYRMIDASRLAELRGTDSLIYENEQYGSAYAIDRAGLLTLINQHKRPVIHVGQPAAVSALLAAELPVELLPVELWCDRATAAHRLAERSPHELTARLSVYDSTPKLDPDALPTLLSIDTGARSPGLTTDAIESRLRTVY